jgi:hypothetical protein
LSVHIAADAYFYQKPNRSTALQMTRFHSDEYITFLEKVSPDNLDEIAKLFGGLDDGLTRCMCVSKMGERWPVPITNSAWHSIIIIFPLCS